MPTNQITYTRPSLDTEYDYVGIIDGLSDTERQKHQITKALKSFLQGEGVATATALVHTENQLLSALDRFHKEAISGKRFMLHFISHGNENGLWVGSDFVNWSTFRPFFQAIHSATDQTLLINMSTCKGLHGIKIVDKDGDYPFFALIGAKSNLLIVDALNANKIMYKKWLNDMPVHKIVPETNNELGKEVLFHVSAEGFRISTP